MHFPLISAILIQLLSLHVWNLVLLISLQCYLMNDDFILLCSSQHNNNNIHPKYYLSSIRIKTSSKTNLLLLVGFEPRIFLYCQLRGFCSAARQLLVPAPNTNLDDSCAPEVPFTCPIESSSFSQYINRIHRKKSLRGLNFTKTFTVCAQELQQHVLRWKVRWFFASFSSKFDYFARTPNDFDKVHKLRLVGTIVKVYCIMNSFKAIFTFLS